MTSLWTRRQILTGLATLPVCQLIGGPATWGWLEARDGLWAHRLVATLGAPESAAYLGMRYLEAVPEERSVRRLVQLLLGNDRPAQHDLRSLGWVLEAMREEDFANEDVVVLGGWWLAKSEARVCALAALLA